MKICPDCAIILQVKVRDVIKMIEKDGWSEMKYLVIIEETKTGYSAFSPDLPVCAATGSGKEEVEERMKGAIAFHLEGMGAEGLEAPQPHSFSTYLEVSA